MKGDSGSPVILDDFSSFGFITTAECQKQKFFDQKYKENIICHRRRPSRLELENCWNEELNKFGICPSVSYGVLFRYIYKGILQLIPELNETCEAPRNGIPPTYLNV